MVVTTIDSMVSPSSFLRVTCTGCGPDIESGHAKPIHSTVEFARRRPKDSVNSPLLSPIENDELGCSEALARHEESEVRVLHWPLVCRLQLTDSYRSDCVS